MNRELPKRTLRRERVLGQGLLLLLLGGCGGGSGGPTGPQDVRIRGEWLVTGDVVLAVDNCNLDAVVDLEGEAESAIAGSDGTLTITQNGSNFTIHGDFNLDGTISSQGDFETREVVEQDGGVTTRSRVEGSVSGERMTGIFVFVFENLPGFPPTCTVHLGFVANRISTTPRVSRAGTGLPDAVFDPIANLEPKVSAP